MRSECEAVGGEGSMLLASSPCPQPTTTFLSPFPSRGSQEPGFSHRPRTSWMKGTG